MIRYDAHLMALFLVKNCNIGAMVEMMKAKNSIDCYGDRVYSSSYQYGKLIKH
jgi:hypothetical protein